MRQIRRQRVLSVLAVIALVASLAPSLSSAADQEDLQPLRLRANGGHSSGLTSIVNLSIKSWSTEAEHESILKAARQTSSVPRGDRSLRDALQSSDSHGRIAFQGELGIDVRYAYQVEDEGARRIILAADRPIGAFEAVEQGALSLDYNITMAVIELDESGRGEGELWAAAAIRLDDDGQLEPIGIDVDPIRLGKIRVLN